MSILISQARQDFYKNVLMGVEGELLSSEPAALLTGTGIKMDGKVLSPQDTIDLGLGSSYFVSVEDFAHLFGVFDGSRVVYQRDAQFGLTAAPAGMYATIINPRLIKSGYKNKCGLVRVESGVGLSLPGLFVDHYMLSDDAPQLLGTVAFGLCAIRAFLLGLDDISLIAAGGVGFEKRYIGYKVWPKLGFDAVIEPGEFHESNAPELASCTTVLEAVATDAASWDVHGSQRRMAFDLDPDGYSWPVLIKYLRSKGIGSAP